MGFISKKYGEAQQYHFQMLGFERINKSWLIALIKNYGKYLGTCGNIGIKSYMGN